MRGIFRTTIVLSAIALLMCGLFVGVTFAAFTTYDKGVAQVTVDGIGPTTFSVTTTDKYYPGMTDGKLNISVSYGQTNDMTVRLTDLTLDNIQLLYNWNYGTYTDSPDGVINLTILPKTGSWSAGSGKAGWYGTTEYTYYSDSAITGWRCTLNNGIPTFYYNSTITGGTTLPTFTCDVNVKTPPTGEQQNNAIDGFGQIDTASPYLLDGCESVKFDFSLLLSQV